jgi:hypothetical protein
MPSSTPNARKDIGMTTRWVKVGTALTLVGASLLLMGLAGGSANNIGEVGAFLGRWVLEPDQSSALFEVAEMEFLASNTLLCDTSVQGRADYNIRFEYKVVGPNRIALTAPRRLSSEVEIRRADAMLVVTGRPWPEGTGVFRRATAVNWQYVAWLGALCAAAALLLLVPRIRVGIVGAGAMHSLRFGHAKHAMDSLIALLFFAGGVVGGGLLWSAPALLRVRMPWDATITVELALLLAVLGLRMVVAHHTVFERSGPRGFYLLGALLLAAGIVGVVAGGGRLLLYLGTGFYP